VCPLRRLWACLRESTTFRTGGKHSKMARPPCRISISQPGVLAWCGLGACTMQNGTLLNPLLCGLTECVCVPCHVPRQETGCTPCSCCALGVSVQVCRQRRVCLCLAECLHRVHCEFPRRARRCLLSLRAVDQFVLLCVALCGSGWLCCSVLSGLSWWVQPGPLGVPESFFPGVRPPRNLALSSPAVAASSAACACKAQTTATGSA